ncbi:aspartate aminotransferase family protein [Candidatus Persebacteraceae bacterium Df01]|jgi:putrescine aminotransferase|uniref:Aspartate aminotransferase family protein n=1 Tax=Candidatus Doriopsillibacter californiensis TaxID=2970740 RepID=A0ABT7QN87_9GAMM|nr:aspartate aminotransferase family protein [Candidatus Persebacteraceae bacterium Df01]
MNNTKLTSTAAYQQADAAHYLHPFTDNGALGNNARIICRADGVYLWDTDGNQLLDGMSGLWCVNVGYGRASITQAVAKQMDKLPYYNSFFQCATPPAIELAQTLTEVAPPGFNRVFFAGSGSEANDTVVRMCRYYWQLRGQPQRTVFISRHNAYHGSTVAGVSLGGMKGMHAQGGPLIPDIVHVRQPYWYEEGRDMTPAVFGHQAATAVAEKIEEIGAHRVAAFIGEPVQGAGGVIIPPDSYWPEVQKICAHYDIPIVADEVICGFGRLGEWFGSQRLNIDAKIMPIAKGLTSGYLPMGGVLVHDDIADVLIKSGEFAHGFTYSGHPTCAAAALENIRILREENIISRVRDEVAPYFQKRWATLESHPLVGETRGIGMVAALELVADKASGQRFNFVPGAGVRCREHSAAAGLIMRAVSDTMIVAPPLIISPAQIDELVAKARQALDALANEIIG